MMERFVWPEIRLEYAWLPTRMDAGPRWTWLDRYEYLLFCDGTVKRCRKGWHKAIIQEAINRHYFGDAEQIDEYERSLVTREVALRRFCELMTPTEQEKKDYAKAIDSQKAK